MDADDEDLDPESTGYAGYGGADDQGADDDDSDEEDSDYQFSGQDDSDSQDSDDPDSEDLGSDIMDSADPDLDDLDSTDERAAGSDNRNPVGHGSGSSSMHPPQTSRVHSAFKEPRFMLPQDSLTGANNIGAHPSSSTPTGPETIAQKQPRNDEPGVSNTAQDISSADQDTFDNKVPSTGV